MARRPGWRRGRCGRCPGHDLAAGPAEAAIADQDARSHLFDSLAAKALAIIERGLHIAERAGAIPEMIELLISQSWAISDVGRSDVGRPRAGAIVGLGGLELAERLELAEPQLRAVGMRRRLDEVAPRPVTQPA